MANDTGKVVLTLPGSPEILQEQLKLFCVNKIFRNTPLNKFPDCIQSTLKYTFPCLSNGRLLNEVRILVAGERSIHKRDLASILLSDKLPHTPVKVTSNGIRFYSNTLIAPDGDTNIRFNLTVDVIDLCTGGMEDEHDHTKISNHISNESETYRPAHCVRKIPPNLSQLVKDCRPTEYPNLVLYFVEIGSMNTNREYREIVKFQLTQLHKMNLVDSKFNNLILVMFNDQTNHSSEKGGEVDNSKQPTQGPSRASGNDKLRGEGDIQNEARKQLKEVYNGIIGEVPVLILDCPFHHEKLGQGNEAIESDHPSPVLLQIRKTILNSAKDIFMKNKDNLGLLLLLQLYDKEDKESEFEINEIFKTLGMNKCGDKMKPLEEIDWTFELYPDIATGNDQTAIINMPQVCIHHPMTLDSPVHHGFHSIGQAYCPVTETLKMHNVFSEKELKRRIVMVGETAFSIPEFVDMFLDMSTESWSLTHNSKQSYEAHRKYNYGFEKGVILNVDASSEGNWDRSSKKTNKSDQVLHEVRIAFLQVISPDDFLSEDIKKELKSFLWSEAQENELMHLSEKDKQKKKMQMETSKYETFFAKWGTHFVCKQWIGGYIKTDKKANKVKSKDDTNLLARLRAKLLGNGKQSLGLSSATKSNLFSVIKGGKLSISGHEHDDLMYLEFDQITPELYYSWVNDVKKHPNALNYSFVLYPYYNSRFCKDKDELRRRTLAYLAHEHKNAGGCFPPSTMIRTNINGSKQVFRLAHTESVLSVNSTTSTQTNLVPSKFYTFLHKDPLLKSVFLKLYFSNGKSLKCTDSHLLFTVDENGKLEGKQAYRVECGDRMMYIDENGMKDTPTVLDIQIEQDYGVYCPLTATGTFIADGFLVSCYASVDSFQIAHVAMAPLRAWYELKDRLWKPRNSEHENRKLGKEERDNGIHWYARILMTIRNICGY